MLHKCKIFKLVLETRKKNWVYSFTFLLTYSNFGTFTLLLFDKIGFKVRLFSQKFKRCYTFLKKCYTIWKSVTLFANWVTLFWKCVTLLFYKVLHIFRCVTLSDLFRIDFLSKMRKVLHFNKKKCSTINKKCYTFLKKVLQNCQKCNTIAKSVTLLSKV